jgi:hypothetical protein
MGDPLGWTTILVSPLGDTPSGNHLISTLLGPPCFTPLVDHQVGPPLWDPLWGTSLGGPHYVDTLWEPSFEYPLLGIPLGVPPLVDSIWGNPLVEIFLELPRGTTLWDPLGEAKWGIPLGDQILWGTHWENPDGGTPSGSTHGDPSKDLLGRPLLLHPPWLATPGGPPLGPHIGVPHWWTALWEYTSGTHFGGPPLGSPFGTLGGSPFGPSSRDRTRRPQFGDTTCGPLLGIALGNPFWDTPWGTLLWDTPFWNQNWRPPWLTTLGVTPCGSQFWAPRGVPPWRTQHL